MNFLVLVSSRKICATLHAKLQSGSVSRSPNAKSKNIVRLTLFIVSAFAYCERTSNLHGSIDGFQFTPSMKKHRTFFKVWRICSKTGWLFIRTWKYQRQNKYKYGAFELPNTLNWYHSSNRFRNQNQIHPIVYRYYLFWLLEHWAVSIQHPTGIITIHLACACVYRYRTLSRQC